MKELKMQLGRISTIHYEIFGSNYDIVSNNPLIKGNITLKAKFELHKLGIELEKVLKFLQEEHFNLRKKLGAFNEETNEYIISDKNKFEEEFSKVLETEVSIMVNGISIDLFENVQGVDYCPQFFNLLLELN